MSQQRSLGTVREILLDLAKKRNCAKITGYDKTALTIFVEAVDRAIDRYRKESERVKSYQRG